METVLEYVKVLVWPILIAGVLIGFRHTVTVLIGRIIQLDAQMYPQSLTRLPTKLRC